MEKLIANPPKNVDILLMEGTCLGREDEDGFRPRTIWCLGLADIFQQTKGMPLVWCSGQNIDRIVTIFKACIRADRQFIVDMYTAEILRATGNERLPQASWDRMRVFLPKSQKWRIIQNEAFEVSNSYRRFRIYPEQLCQVASQSVMLFRPSMVRDLEDAKCLDGGCVVCSVWSGYLEKEQNRWFVEWMKRRGLPMHTCHTSGHASVPDLRRMRDAFPDAVAVPVHLSDRGRFAALFGKVAQREDGEWWDT